MLGLSQVIIQHSSYGLVENRLRLVMLGCNHIIIHHNTYGLVESRLRLAMLGRIRPYFSTAYMDWLRVG